MRLAGVRRPILRRPALTRRRLTLRRLAGAARGLAGAVGRLASGARGPILRGPALTRRQLTLRRVAGAVWRLIVLRGPGRALRLAGVWRPALLRRCGTYGALPRKFPAAVAARRHRTLLR